jgi:hypothetical protein
MYDFISGLTFMLQELRVGQWLITTCFVEFESLSCSQTLVSTEKNSIGKDKKFFSFF